MEGQGYRVGAGDGRGWSARAAVGPPSTLYKGENGGSVGCQKVGPLLQVLGFGGGQRRGGPPAGYFWGPGSPGWRRQVLPYRPGEDAPPGKKEAGRGEAGSPADVLGGRWGRDSTVGSPADVLGGRLGGDSTVGSPADVLGRRRAWLGGGGVHSDGWRAGQVDSAGNEEGGEDSTVG